MDFIRRASEDLAVQNIVAVTSKTRPQISPRPLKTVPSAISRSRTPIFTMSETTFAFSVPTEVRSADCGEGLSRCRTPEAGRQAGCFSSGKPSCRRESLVTERNRSSQSSCPRHELRRDQFRSEHLLPHVTAHIKKIYRKLQVAFPRRSGLRSRPARNSSGHVIQKPRLAPSAFSFSWFSISSKPSRRSCRRAFPANGCRSCTFRGLQL